MSKGSLENFLSCSSLLDDSMNIFYPSGGSLPGDVKFGVEGAFCLQGSVPEQLCDTGQFTKLLMPQSPHLVNGNKVIPTS